MKNFCSKVTYWLLPVLLLAMAGLTSCNPEDEEDVFEQTRMFMPTGQVVSTSGETQVRLSWKPSLFASGNVTYTVEIAADTLFETPVIFSTTTDTSSVVLTDDNIPVKQKFFARIKTNALGNVPESKWLVSNGFSIRGVQLFIDNPVKSEDINDRGARLRFTSRAELTKVVVTSATGQTKEFNLTQDNLNTGTVIVDDLVPGATYTAELFAGARSRGVTFFQTKQPLAGILIDLRGIEGRPEVLEDTLSHIPNGSTVILKRGETYTISSTVNLDKSVIITSGSDLSITTLASIYFTSNFNIVAGSNIDFFELRDVNVSSDNATSRYIFNINNASTIKKMLFDNVKASMFRGLVRLQSAPTIITDFIINNSVIDSIGSYGVVNVDVATSKIENFLITNSTIYKAERIIASRNNSTSVIIENVTFNEVPRETQYLIDFSASLNVTNGIKIRNSIFGIGKADNDNFRGVRAGSSTSIETSGTYVTSDHVATSFALPETILYNGTSLNLWVNPKNGNFRFKDQSFAGKNSAGDPRWR